MHLRPGRHAVVEVVPQQTEKRDNQQLLHLNEIVHRVEKTKPALW